MAHPACMNRHACWLLLLLLLLASAGCCCCCCWLLHSSSQQQQQQPAAASSQHLPAAAAAPSMHAGSCMPDEPCVFLSFNAYCGLAKIRIWVNIHKTHRRLNLAPRSLMVHLYIDRVLKTCSTCLHLYIHYILMLSISISVYTLFFTRTLHRKLDLLRVSDFYKVTVRRPP